MIKSKFKENNKALLVQMQESTIYKVMIYKLY